MRGLPGAALGQGRAEPGQLPMPQQVSEHEARQTCSQTLHNGKCPVLGPCLLVFTPSLLAMALAQAELPPGAVSPTTPSSADLAWPHPEQRSHSASAHNADLLPGCSVYSQISKCTNFLFIFINSALTSQ